MIEKLIAAVAAIAVSHAAPAEADYAPEIAHDVKVVHHRERSMLHRRTPFFGHTDWKHAMLWLDRRRHWNRKWTPWGITWFGQSQCIHRAEGAWNDDTGNGYYGGMQFLLSTWAGVNREGYGRPDLEPPHVQRLLAFRVWLRDGGSWREWGTAAGCGLS